MKRTGLFLLVVCAAATVSACGGSGTTSATTEAVMDASVEESSDAETQSDEETSAAEESEEEGTSFSEQGKILLDNDLMLITLGEEIEESNYVGYSVVLENKTADQYLLLGIDNGSVDGMMTYINIQGGSVAPGKKSNAEFRFYTNDDSDIKALSDLRNIEGAFTLSSNTDGGNSYRGTGENYPFSIDGNTGAGSTGAPADEAAESGQVILDNEFVKITLGDPIEESTYVGYSAVVENKSSDQYLLLGIDNGSVDGFMASMDLSSSSVAPGKKSKSEFRVFTEGTGIKSTADLKNVEGSITISKNTDGANLYRDKTSYPFTIGGENAETASEGASEAGQAANAPVAANETTSGASGSQNNTETITLGQTVTGEGWEFTLNNVELTYELKPRNTSGFYTSYPAPEGKVYVHIDGDYHNTSKQDVCIRDLPVPSADYDNGYTYEGFAITDEDDNDFTWASSYVVCTPLETCHYHGMIECPKVIDESDAPLFVTIKMPGGKLYRYDIR